MTKVCFLTKLNNALSTGRIFRLVYLAGAVSQVNHKGLCPQRCIVEKANKAETSSEEQTEKAECCWENLWNEIQLKGP